jgi:hypothetical protein
MPLAIKAMLLFSVLFILTMKLVWMLAFGLVSVGVIIRAFIDITNPY